MVALRWCSNGVTITVLQLRNCGITLVSQWCYSVTVVVPVPWVQSTLPQGPDRPPSSSAPACVCVCVCVCACGDHMQHCDTDYIWYNTTVTPFKSHYNKNGKLLLCHCNTTVT
jgi:hypothetical protein